MECNGAICRKLNDLKSILLMEKERIIENFMKRGTFRGELLACRRNVGVIEAEKILTPGTLLGYVDESVNESVSELGYIISSGRYMVVKLLKVPESEKLNLIELENLISYDLQIEAIEKCSWLPEVTGRVVKGEVDGLDEWQSSAALSSLELEDGELLLVVGPPGTGKTAFISRAAELAASTGNRVLITSHTNRAVDNVIERQSSAIRVGNPSKISPQAQKFSLELLASKKVCVEEASSAEELVEITAERLKLLEKEMLNILNRARIVGSTLIKCALFPMLEQSFDIVFVDEASQALISAVLLGLEKGRRFVLVGDPFQLPPVLSRDASKYSAFNFFHSENTGKVIWLRNHYRSNSEIIGFVSKYVYRNRIKPHRSCKNIKLEITPEGEFAEALHPDKPLVFVSVNGREEGRGSKYNREEARTAAELCGELVNCGLNKDEVGIITPYVRQAKLISGMVDGVEVNTVDAFQGREKDVIIFSVTSTIDLGFASNPKRFNVAITRARKKFIAIGNEKAFKIPANRSTLLYRLYLHTRSKDCFFRLNF